MSDEDKTTEQPEENKEIGTSVQKTEAAPVSKDAPEEHQDEATDDGATPVAFTHRDLKQGMVVRVHEVIKDTNAKGEERERVQMFEGTVLGLNGSGIGRTITVRKVSDGVGVEKIYPLASPHVREIDIIKQYRVRRAKLWYLKRDKKKRRLKEVPLKT